jgi:hypothetical protein
MSTTDTLVLDETHAHGVGKGISPLTSHLLSTGVLAGLQFMLQPCDVVPEAYCDDVVCPVLAGGGLDLDGQLVACRCQSGHLLLAVSKGSMGIRQLLLQLQNIGFQLLLVFC